MHRHRLRDLLLIGPTVLCPGGYRDCRQSGEEKQGTHYTLNIAGQPRISTLPAPLWSRVADPRACTTGPQN